MYVATVLILMERMIQFNKKISFSRILIMFIYGAIDNQKIAHLAFKIETIFSSYIVLD